MNHTGLSSAMGTSTNLYLFVKLKMCHPLFYYKRNSLLNLIRMWCFLSIFFSSLFTGPKFPIAEKKNISNELPYSVSKPSMGYWKITGFSVSLWHFHYIPSGEPFLCAVVFEAKADLCVNLSVCEDKMLFLYREWVMVKIAHMRSWAVKPRQEGF